MASRYDQPDAGYAWAILVASFTLNFLAASGVVTLGIFLVEYLEQFNQSNAYTAGIAAAHLATWGVSGKNSVIHDACIVNWDDKLLGYALSGLAYR